MKIIDIQLEHRDTLEAHIIHIQRHDELLRQAQERFESSKQCMELLAAAWKHIPKDNAENLDPLILRNSEHMAYFLSDAREMDKEVALYSSIIQALKEAMTFFLAEHYGIDVTKDWQLDLDKNTLVCQE